MFRNRYGEKVVILSILDLEVTSSGVVANLAPFWSHGALSSTPVLDFPAQL